MPKKLILAAVLALIATLSGCTTGPSGPTGNLVLQITDQPAGLNITSALVTISSVQVHMASQNESNESGWITVVQGPQTFDLVAIKDVKEFLGSAQLTPGIYTQIRLNVDSALATINGAQHNLTIPSGTVKLVSPFQIAENQTTTLTLDFNAEQSIHQADGKYIMRPTIQVIQESAADGSQSMQKACTDSGGTVATQSCCKSTDSFPNTCLIGACGCSPDNSSSTKVCDCGPGKCFDGGKCVAIQTPEQGCISSGGTVTTQSCCKSASDFPRTCAIGACGCSPDNSKQVRFCECPQGACFDGIRCVVINP